DDLVHVGGQVHLGRSGGTQLQLVQSALAGLVQRGVDDFAHEVTAEGLLDVRGRHLARTEALQLHLGSHFLDAGFELFVQLCYRNGYIDHAAESFVRFFDDLHGRVSDALWRRRKGARWIKQQGRPFRERRLGARPYVEKGPKRQRNAVPLWSSGRYLMTHEPAFSPHRRLRHARYAASAELHDGLVHEDEEGR